MHAKELYSERRRYRDITIEIPMLFLFLLPDAGTGGFFPIVDIGKAPLKIGMSSSSCFFLFLRLRSDCLIIYCHPMLSTIDNTQAWMTRLREIVGHPSIKKHALWFCSVPGCSIPCSSSPVIGQNGCAVTFPPNFYRWVSHFFPRKFWAGPLLI